MLVHGAAFLKLSFFVTLYQQEVFGNYTLTVHAVMFYLSKLSLHVIYT